jgi:hypothetical protein
MSSQKKTMIASDYLPDLYSLACADVQVMHCEQCYNAGAAHFSLLHCGSAPHPSEMCE